MFVKNTARRQVTFPARVPEALGVKPGDRLELEEGPDGFGLRTRHIDRARPVRAPTCARQPGPVRARDAA